MTTTDASKDSDHVRDAVWFARCAAHRNHTKWKWKDYVAELDYQLSRYFW